MQTSLPQILSPCAGVIVIDVDEKKTVLVCTKQDNYSFPKGKRNKNETTLNCALRELEEETGLKPTDIELFEHEMFDEKSDRGGLATRYYVAKLLVNKGVSFDEDELKKVEWIKIDDVYKLEKFKDRRKDILREVEKKYLLQSVD